MAAALPRGRGPGVAVLGPLRGPQAREQPGMGETLAQGPALCSWDFPGSICGDSPPFPTEARTSDPYLKHSERSLQRNRHKGLRRGWCLPRHARAHASAVRGCGGVRTPTR